MLREFPRTTKCLKIRSYYKGANITLNVFNYVRRVTRRCISLFIIVAKHPFVLILTFCVFYLFHFRALNLSDNFEAHFTSDMIIITVLCKLMEEFVGGWVDGWMDG
jgi:hypothetical protein